MQFRNIFVMTAQLLGIPFVSISKIWGMTVVDIGQLQLSVLESISQMWLLGRAGAFSPFFVILGWSRV
jgi:hypothetical protein